MRFLYIKVLQILNQMVDLMLRIVGHVPRVSRVTGMVSSLNFFFGGGDNAIDVRVRPNANFGVSPCTPRDLRPWPYQYSGIKIIQKQQSLAVSEDER